MNTKNKFCLHGHGCYYVPLSASYSSKTLELSLHIEYVLMCIICTYMHPCIHWDLHSCFHRVLATLQTLSPPKNKMLESGSILFIMCMFSPVIFCVPSLYCVPLVHCFYLHLSEHTVFVLLCTVNSLCFYCVAVCY